MDLRPIEKLKTDVAVVGGGAAGVAAAVAASRAGLSVILIERYGFCGGGAVAGLSGTLCGFYLASGDATHKPEQVVFGFADEFRRKLDDFDGLGPPLKYGKTYTHVHEPAAWKSVADFFLEGSGVQVIYHAVAIATLSDGVGHLSGVELWTKQGRVEVRAQCVIDASGDADIVAMSGLPSLVGDNGRVQNPTLIFRMSGVDRRRFHAAYGVDTIMPAAISELIQAEAGKENYNLPRSKIWLFPTTRPDEILCNCTRVLGSDGRELNCLFWRDFAEAEINGRRQMSEYARFFCDHLIGFDTAFVNDVAPQVGVRQTRQLQGQYRLRNADVTSGLKSPDGIARSPWPIELHSGTAPHVEWLLGDFYEVPLGCLIPSTGSGLIAAGRCLSAEHEAVASARVTAQCFSYGQAAGLAAWLSIRERVEPSKVRGSDVRELLNQAGAQLN